MRKRRLGKAGVVGVTVAAAALVTMAWLATDSARAHATDVPATASGETRVVNGAVYPVNENGQTYGPVAPDADGGRCTSHGPDLIVVGMPDGSEGYVVREDFAWFETQGAPNVDIKNPEEAVAWMEAGQPMDPIPIYGVDGTTQIGWWAGENGVCEARWL